MNTLLVAPLVDDVPSPAEVGPGWIAAVVMLALVIVTVLLWRNMRKQLKKIDFDEEPEAPPEPDGRPN
jgi:hypothetical protein